MATPDKYQKALDGEELKVEMEVDKRTKNTVRFTETNVPTVRNVYVPKDIWEAWGSPSTIHVTISAD